MKWNGYEVDAKPDIMQPKFGSREYLAAEVVRLRAINKDLLEALCNVPDPEDEGYCEHCGERLELAKETINYKDKTVGERHFFQHTTCWYAKAQAAIRKAKEGK